MANEILARLAVPFKLLAKKIKDVRWFDHADLIIVVRYHTASDSN